jgi:predicted flavoprotein YhiN
MNDKDKEELEKKLQDYESDWIKMREIAEKMQAENKKLREALEFYSNNQITMTTENGIYLRDGLNGDFFSLKEKAREALKEIGEK